MFCIIGISNFKITFRNLKIIYQFSLQVDNFMYFHSFCKFFSRNNSCKRLFFQAQRFYCIKSATLYCTACYLYSTIRIQRSIKSRLCEFIKKFAYSRCCAYSYRLEFIIRILHYYGLIIRNCSPCAQIL